MEKVKGRVWNVSVFFALLWGIFVFLYSTNRGMGVSPDSVVYIEAAQNLAKGKGHVTSAIKSDVLTIDFYAPLYPFLLASGELLGIAPLSMAKVMNLLFWCATILLLGVVLKELTSSPFLLPVVSFAVASFPNMLRIYTMAWTEGCFITFGILAYLFFLKYIRTEKRGRLFTAALSVGIAFLCRYAGIVLIITGILGIFVLLENSIFDRFRKAFWFAVISSVPTALWLFWKFMQGKGMAQRKFVFHPLSFGHLVDLKMTVESWLVPSVFPDVLKNSIFIIYVAFFLFCTIWLFKGKFSTDKGIDGIKLQIYFSALYLAFLFVSISFFDAHIPLDNRILSPLWISLFVVSVYFLWRIYRRIKKARFLRIVFLACLSTFVTLNFVRTFKLSVLFHSEGQGYNSKVWRESRLLKLLEASFSDKDIYSNAPEVVYFLLKRPATMLPCKQSPMTLLPGQQFIEKYNEMLSDVRSGKSVIVYFDRISWRWYLPSKKELMENTYMFPVEVEGEGTIFKANGQLPVSN